MSWYKFAKDFSTRNTINHKIIYLKELREVLDKTSKVVFQSGTEAKNTTTKIITAKQITSYPILEDMIREANAAALDSPHRFSSLCNEVCLKIGDIILTLENEREHFTNGGDSPVRKGWFE